MREHTSRLVALVHGNAPLDNTELRHRAASIALRLNPAGFGNDPLERGKHPLDRDIHAALGAIVTGKETGIDAAAWLERLIALLLKQVWEDSKDEGRQATLV